MSSSRVASSLPLFISVGASMLWSHIDHGNYSLSIKFGPIRWTGSWLQRIRSFFREVGGLKEDGEESGSARYIIEIAFETVLGQRLSACTTVCSLPP